MEPTAVVGALAKLLTVGIKSWEAYLAGEFGAKDLEAWRAALEAGGATLGLHEQPKGNALAQHLGLVIAAFGRAFERHWVGTKPFHSGFWRRFFDRDAQELQHEIEVRLRLAEIRLPDLGLHDAGLAEFEAVDSLVHGPLHTSWYRALWNAFTHPNFTNAQMGEQPPLDLQKATRREFERHFLLAYWEGLGREPGRILAPHFKDLEQYRTRIVREMLVADLASWGARHIFGNLPRTKWSEDKQLPFLPLGEMYVEPSGRPDKAPPDQPGEPILGLLERWLGERATRIIIVKADFGMGKSLTARTLAQRLAANHLEDPRVSLDLPLPVFVRCAQHFIGEEFDLLKVVQRAWKHQAEELQVSLSTNNPAFAHLDEKQRMVFFLDGLDEVKLGERQLETLFDRLRDIATERWQFVIFSRPGVLPRDEALKGVRIVELLHFGVEEMGGALGQVGRWLDAWNRLVRPEKQPITLAALETRRLLELAGTPILLFMIAHSWDEHAGSEAPVSPAALYERFFRQVARGKVELDREQHPVIYEASRHLLEELRAAGHLARNDPELREPDAMLWLLSRVAWEAHRRAWRGEREMLDRRIVTNLLLDELHLDGEMARTIEIGLLLALQADLHSGTDQILFGHKSFREFLVARWWADRLKKLAQGRSRDWSQHTEQLLGARLLAEDDGSYDFLLQMLNGEPAGWSPSSPLHWDDGLREKLVEWAVDCFNDEAQDFEGLKTTALRADPRAVLREAALALGSQTLGSPGLKARDPLTLRSLLAWFWLVEERPRIVAPNAHLDGASLDGARLDGASLDGARLDGARLVRASLDGASLVGARLVGASLVGASLDSASLDGASLVGASLVRARLDGARLVHARLVGAILAGAILDGARLDGARLDGARLDGARLDGAILDGARLDGAILDGAIYDDDTRWPVGFDPVAAGAIHVRDLKK